MNIAIIGCGYVGYAVSQYWQQNKNFIITATTTTTERVPGLQKVAQKVIVTQGNDLESLKTVLQNQDVVLLSVGAKSATTYEDTYLQTAKNLVSILRTSPNVHQLIYTGSYSVYGDRNGVWVDEETPPAPANLNAQILRKTEDVLLSAENETLRVCILRLGGIYGPGRELVKIFGRLAGATRPGKGEDITNWVHLDDIVGAIEFARHHRLQGIYNLVDDSHLSSRELIDNVLTKHNLSNVIWDATNKSNRPYNTWVSNQKLKDAGYEFIHPQIIF
ncbi:NAD-dependent epimerase/dehydratase family protein [Sphaerospermopsis aphanizomenoides BCCUSP55]|uniref:NAD-dependent epimerase/dehydratase family protein n=1 Tax=Sphaerospermopsis aphanizomenoides TaxID=459663 RepID=UPI00190553B3|nr:NAD-dependent epimerase/dehydratase family protein [Sphaerospermopsis aphanizomenoides]MBK1988990.1 NAD-dependent epimerase/dehydratase family protein [Sphaerospermopsis aphanizomenoides BCCUSP55]